MAQTNWIGSLTGRFLALACRPYDANEVFVTGTFDDWGKTVKLDQVDGVFVKEVSLPADQKVQYKVCLRLRFFLGLVNLFLPSFFALFPPGASGAEKKRRCGERGCLRPRQPQLCMTLHPRADVTWPVPLSQNYKTTLCHAMRRFLG